MKQVSTLFLKIAVVFIGIPIIALCIFFVPEFANIAAELNTNSIFMKIYVYIVFYVSVIPFYFALYQAIKILSNIDKNKAFSKLSVYALKKIKYCAISISCLHAFMLPVFFLFADQDDAPGVVFVGMVVPFASIVIAVFAAVLQKLLEEAIEIKTENELTV